MVGTGPRTYVALVMQRMAIRPIQPRPPADVRQLSLGGVLAVWAAAALPMGALAWLVAPALADRLGGENATARSLLITLTGGLVWQGLLVAILVRRETGTFRWPAVREALWLRSPRDPATGRPSRRLWLVVPVLIVLFGAEEIIPEVPHPSKYDFAHFLDSASGKTFLSGNWGYLALIVVMLVFNTVLGEELLFRGYLLPRMQRSFGRWDWLANGVLFACYHLHMPWTIPATTLDSCLLAWPTKRYRSAVIGIVVHSVQSLVIGVVVLVLVLR